MIDPKSLAFDIDGVVADTMTLFIDIVKNEFGISDICYEDITCYNLTECLDIHADILDEVIGKLLDGRYEGTLRPIDGASGVLARLGKEYGPLVFVTARPYVGPIEEWMKNLLSLESDDFDIITTGSFDAKAEVLARKEISWFVEDRIETCFMLEKTDTTPVLFKQPWNRCDHPFVEVGSWMELESLIDF